MFHQNDKGMTSMFVEDNFMVRDEEALNETINYIQSTFKVKIYDNNSDYLGCEFIVSSDSKRGWLGQPHVVKSLDKEFGQLVQDVSPTKHLDPLVSCLLNHL